MARFVDKVRAEVEKLEGEKQASIENKEATKILQSLSPEVREMANMLILHAEVAAEESSNGLPFSNYQDWALSNSPEAIGITQVVEIVLASCETYKHSAKTADAYKAYVRRSAANFAKAHEEQLLKATKEATASHTQLDLTHFGDGMKKEEPSEVTPDLSNNHSTASSPHELYSRAALAIRYRNEIYELAQSIIKLPVQFQQQFIDKLEDKPQEEADVLDNEIQTNYQKWCNPFDNPEANKAINILREISEEAEREFIRIYEVLGDSISLKDVVEKIQKDIGINETDKKFGKMPFNKLDDAITYYKKRSILSLMEFLQVHEDGKTKGYTFREKPYNSLINAINEAHLYRKNTITTLEIILDKIDNQEAKTSSRQRPS